MPCLKEFLIGHALLRAGKGQVVSRGRHCGPSGN
jgi:hypothetical protein